MLIYEVTNRKNGKVYIGKWRGESAQRRWAQHVSEAKRGGDRYLCRAIRKYDSDVFAVEVIYRAKTDDELSKMETFFIILHQSHRPENGYNMTLGGDGTVGWKHSEETKQAMSDSRQGYEVSKETGRAISKAKKDKPLSFEHRQALSAAKKGKRLSEEHKQAIAASKPESTEETRQVYRNAWNGHTPEFKAWLVRKGAATRWGHVFVEPKPNVYSEVTPCKL